VLFALSLDKIKIYIESNKSNGWRRGRGDIRSIALFLDKVIDFYPGNNLYILYVQLL